MRGFIQTEDLTFGDLNGKSENEKFLLFFLNESGTVSHLLKAAKECHGKSQKEKMRALSQVFSTHRHVGESEAYYKICPELHLSHSSIQTVYEHTGFPENRRIFLRRLLTKDENGNALPDEEENDEN